MTEFTPTFMIADGNLTIAFRISISLRDTLKQGPSAKHAWTVIASYGRKAIRCSIRYSGLRKKKGLVFDVNEFRLCTLPVGVCMTDLCPTDLLTPCQDGHMEK